MQIHNPNYREDIERIFRLAPFVVDLGVAFVDCGPGWCETRLELEEKHQQHDGFTHAGVLATLADHTAGAAGYTLCPAGKIVLTVEFKINVLRAGGGDALRCRAEVLKPGRMFTIVESSVYAQAGDVEKLVSKSTVTLALTPKPASP